MGTDHEKQIADYLANNAGLSVSVKAGGFRPGYDDDIVVVRYDQTSPSPEYEFGRGEEIKYPRIRAVARAPSNKRETAKDRARTIWDTLSGAQPSGYMVVLGVGSQPVPMGQDEDNRWRYAARFECQIYE